MSEPDGVVVVGRITAVFGVRGEVRVHSLTDPPENLCEYRPWMLADSAGVWGECEPMGVRGHGRGLIARFKGVDDRDAAQALVGRDVAVRRSELPPTEAGEHYWIDLIGLRVVTTEGCELGAVSHLMETGANDVLVVQGDRERLIPYLPGQVVMEVRTQDRCIVVDWDPEF